MTAASPDQKILRAASRKISLQLASVFAAVVVVVVVAAVVFIVQRSQPTEMIEHAAKPGTIYIGSNDVLIALVGGGLLGIALAALAGLLSARRAIAPLADALATQRRFVQDASHELRTPLAILDARLQLAQRQAGDDSTVAPTLARLRQDSAALAALVDDLLSLSAAALQSSDGRSEVTAVVAGVIDDLQPVARSTEVTLSLVPLAEPTVAMSGLTLRRIVTALVENALNHTAPGGNVQATVSTDANQATVRVSDNGTGISGIDPARIFDRFARGSSGDERERRGYGIGLALVKEAVESNGGDVRVSETSEHGTTITVTLPQASALPGADAAGR